MLRNLIKSCKQVADGLMSAAPLAPKPVVLFSFTSQKAVDSWHVFTDAFFGGRSQADLTYNAQDQAAEFSGRCSAELPDDADMKRAGYCVASSKVQHIGDYFDLSGFSRLVYTVKGDGRTYLANVRIDSLAGTGGDVWQAPFSTRPNEWSEVVIPIHSLAMTYQGQLVERKLEFQADKVIGVGLSVAANTSSAEGSGVIDRTDDSTGDNSSGRYSANVSQSSAVQEQQQQQQPESRKAREDAFRILIKSIRAEGEM